MAEGVGFEPTDGTSPSLDFESSPFDHSGIPPRANLAGRSSASKLPIISPVAYLSSGKPYCTTRTFSRVMSPLDIMAPSAGRKS